MSQVNPEFIERYQAIYEKDRNSRVFAPLAEAYRRMGMLDEAQKIAGHGVQVHPNFSSGLVVFARVLIDRGEDSEALGYLKKVCDLSPENILAFQLLGECQLRLREAKDALTTFKMVLFLNPEDRKAMRVVRKLESLSADEFDESVFGTVDPEAKNDFIEEQLRESKEEKPKRSTEQNMRWLERHVSLIDAFIVRNDLAKAQSAVGRALKELGKHPEILQRQNLLMEKLSENTEDEELEPMPSREQVVMLRKRKLLENLLQRVSERRIHS